MQANKEGSLWKRQIAFLLVYKGLTDNLGIS
jgi:hypothetical protein